jgi:hypothetical protein
MRFSPGQFLVGKVTDNVYLVLGVGSDESDACLTLMMITGRLVGQTVVRHVREFNYYVLAPWDDASS